MFNGDDLTGFTVHGGDVAWEVNNGVVRNVSPGNDGRYLTCDAPLPGGDFVLEVRVRIVEGMRFRMRLIPGNLWIGNEGYERQFEIYGSRVSNRKQVGEDLYVLNRWYDLRLEVQQTGEAKLYKDGTLTHTAMVSPLQDSHQIHISPGDNWSPGKIEIASLRYASPIPESDADW